MDELIKRIPDNMLVADAQAGEVWSHLDVNDVYTITKTAINANYFDIQKILKGDLLAGNSLALEGAKLSTSLESVLQSNDTLIPSSKQVKDYVDEHISDTIVHMTQNEKNSYIGHINDNNIHVTIDDKQNWNSKADISDIPTTMSQLTNDSSYLKNTNIVAGANVGILRDGDNVVISSTGGSGSGGAAVDNKSLTINSGAFAQLAGAEIMMSSRLLNKAVLVANRNITGYDFKWEELDINSINISLANKVDKVTGKGLSTNDFTDVYKTKLDNLSVASDNITYNNGTSKLAATNVKSAIDELKALIDALSAKFVGFDKLIASNAQPAVEPTKTIVWLNTN